MTERRYLTDTTAREFETTVERTVDDRVVLAETLFYPEGGGQPADTGLLRAGDREWSVVDVRKKDTVYHELDGEPPAPGTRVAGELDWERRYAHMRYHTAQHLLSAHLLEAYDARTVGNQLYADRARIDVTHDRFTESDMADVEARLNDLVAADMPVEWYTMDRERAEAELDPDRTRVHLLPDSISEVRIVEIGDYDRTACAGTHVERTGEIGPVTVTGRETKGTDEERLTFELGEAPG